MESFNLNIIPGKDRPVCHASQYDIGRTIRVNLFEGFNVFTLDGTEVISISVRKPDGNVVTESVTNTSDSYVEFVTTEQMTACHGSNLCELKLEKGADVIGTMNFILEVEQDPLEGGVQSASEIDNLETQIAGMVATEVADQYDSANVIFDAVPTAGHGVGYAVTSEGVKDELDQKATIDDSTPSQTTVYSSDKVEGLLALKQDATDSDLQTTDQTVVGAINEVNAALSGKADYSVVTTPTLNNQFIDVSDSWFYTKKIGNYCFINGRLKLISAVSNNYGLVFNMPPATGNSLMLVFVSGRDFNNKANTFIVSCVVSSGTLTIQTYPDNIESGKYLYINAFYEC